jgi:16S rRNA (guanine527-N7)-methyltransferase
VWRAAVAGSSPPDPSRAVASDDIVAGAAELGVLLTAAQADGLARYAELLQHWNAVHNLTSIASPQQIFSHHLLDSLAILPAIDAIFGDRPLKVLDVGAGGGVPGIPLAIARAGWTVALVDKVAKKVAFLTQAKIELALSNVRCLHARVEALPAGAYDLIVARAFGSLSELVRLTRHLLAPGGRWAAMKGVRPDAELAALRAEHPDVRVVDTIKLAVPRLGAERHLILLQP